MPPEPKRRIRAGLDAIARGDVKQLRGRLSGWSRLRVGRYWIIFRVEADIQIAAIGPRETIYEEAARLLKAVKERRGGYRTRSPKGRRSGVRSIDQ